MEHMFLKYDTPLIKDAHKATQMSTFPADYSAFLNIALQCYNVLFTGTGRARQTDTKANRRQF